MTPDGLPPLRDVIASLQLSARKSLSQNFILDLNLTRKIARAGGPLEGVSVIEIGPGPGGLTRALLLEGAARVAVIERDERCLPALEQIAAHYPGRLDIIIGDALQANYDELAARLAPPVRLAANLPYAIATPLVVAWLKTPKWPPWYDCMVLMFQREVAQRLLAPRGSKAYGRLSVLAQWRTTIKVAFHLPPQAFTPPPKVASSVVVLTPKAILDEPCDTAMFEAVTSAAFGQRRKMLRTSLKPVLGDVVATLDALGIRADARAEDLSYSDFCRIAAASLTRTT